MSSDISVVIKSPNQKATDIQIDCKTDWSVKQLKQKIFSTHPEKPEIKQQRLIFSGKMLQDDANLGDSLKCSSCSDTEFILHLVISKKDNSLVNKTSNCPPISITSISGLSFNFSESEKKIMADFQLAPDVYLDYVRQYKEYCLKWYLDTTSDKLKDIKEDSTNIDDMELLVSSSSAACSSSSLNSDNNNPREPVVDNQRVPPAAVPEPVNGPVGGILQENIDNVPQDGADFFYAIFRMLFMGAFIYYYSSIGKAVTSLIMFGIIVLLQNNFFRDKVFLILQKVRQFFNPPPVISENNMRSPNIQIEENNSGGDAQASQVHTQIPPPIVARGNTLVVIYEFLKSIAQMFITLLTSLVPERPPPVDPN